MTTSLPAYRALAACCFAVLLVLAISSSQLRAQTWRSSLYPETWQRPDGTASFDNDKLIQDFSYAGYKRGEEPVPTIAGPVYNVVTGYSADPSGTNDSTVAIQNAIDAAEAAGGGVVYLPAGTYKVSPQASNNYSLLIDQSHVVLRGAGSASTFLLNTSTAMRSKSIIEMTGTITTGTAVSITADLLGPTKRIPVATPGSFAPGDMVRIEWSFTDAWVAEHGQQSYWNATKGYPSDARYLREVVSVNVAEGWIEVDVPTRYSIKTRDSARVSKVTGMVSDVGVESLSIGNVQHSSTTWGENDFSVVGTGAYDTHGSFMVKMANLQDSWITGVKSFQAAGNTSTCHMLSNGIGLHNSTRITISDCWMGRPQYGGGGGNGYMYRLTNSNESLIKSSTADFSRHGFVISSAGTSGNVFFQCDDRETGRATGSTGSYNTSGSGSDNHMHFSHSNLWDQCHAHNSYYTASHRGTSGTIPHGLTSAHAVYWNTTGSGTRYATSSNTIVRSVQGRYGYVIGTRATDGSSSYSVTNTTSGNTAPADHVEGVNSASTLSPVSLYLDQLERRLRPIVTYAGNGANGGSVPSDPNNPYSSGASVTILSAGTMTRTGYAFAGWNTQADGSGVSYAPGSTLNIDNHLTLYAQWAPPSFTVTFDANGGEIPMPTSISVTLNSTYGTLASTTRTNHTFMGWFTAPSGGTQITSLTTVSTAADHALYAQWLSHSMSQTLTASLNSVDAIIGMAQANAGPTGYRADFNSGMAGGGGAAGDSTRYSMVPIIGFSLPTMPTGHTINSVKLHYKITAYRYQNDPNFTADSYLLNSANPSTTGTSFYYMGASDPNANAKKIGSTDLPDGATNISITANPVISVSHTLSGDVLSMFQNFYTENTPNRAEAFIRFNRSSVDNTDLSNAQLYERFFVDPNASNLYLEITTTPPASTPPSLAPTDIVDDASGGTVISGNSLTYTLSFSEDMDKTTLNASDFGNAGSASVTIGTITKLSPGVFRVTVTATSTGSLQLCVNAGAVMTDLAGEALNTTSAIVDNTTLTVTSAFDNWVADNGGGDETFTGDSNNDGTPDGLAWLLGAETPADDARSLLPAFSKTQGDLSLSFKCLKPSARGNFSLSVQYSRDLGITDPWSNHSISIPDVSGTHASGVIFTIVQDPQNPNLNQVHATIPASASAGTGNLFVRISGQGP